jgi:hypothetical protein
MNEQTLDELQRECLSIEEEINSIEGKKDYLKALKKEIEVKQEQMKKFAFEALLDGWENVMVLYQEHNEKNSTVCCDTNPLNNLECKRCAMIYLRKYIQNELANYLIM